MNERVRTSPSDMLSGNVRLSELVESIGLAALGKTLQIGTELTNRALAVVAQSTRGPHLAIEVGVASKKLASGHARAKTVGTDPFNVPLPQSLKLCVVDLGAANTPDVMEELLYERILPAMDDGGIVIAALVRDARDRALSSLKVPKGRARENLQGFLRNQFGALEIAGSEAFQKKFIRDGGFEFLGWAPLAGRHAAQDNRVWLILRKRRSGAGRGRAFGRTARVDQFPKHDFEMFLRALKEKEIKLLSARKFARRYTQWWAKPREAALFGHAKFDIHANMRRPLEIARIMSTVGYPGLFLMMQKHPLNQAFFDSDETWDTLRRMRDLGHEIGLHADVFHFIRVYGDLYTGLEAALGEMQKRGFTVRSMSLHGDSIAHIKSQRLHATDFFDPSFRRSKWNGKQPVGEEYLAEHVGRYSRAKIWDDFGVEFFSENVFTRRGLRIARRSLLAVSDNSRSMNVSRASRALKRYSGPAQFRIDRAWAREAAALLSRRPFVMLTHPQWYW